MVMRTIDKKWLYLGLLIIITLFGIWFVKSNIKQSENSALLKSRLQPDESPAGLETKGAVTLKCVADFSEVAYGKINITDDVFLKSWVNCYFNDTTGAEKSVAVPLLIESDSMVHVTLGVAVTSKNGKQFEVSPNSVKEHISKGIKIVSPNSTKTVVRVVAGDDSDGTLMHDNPYPNIYSKTGLDQNLQAFAENLDVSLLPKIGDIQKNMFFAYRITVLK